MTRRDATRTSVRLPDKAPRVSRATHRVQPHRVGLQAALRARRRLVLGEVRPPLPPQLVVEPPAAEVRGGLGFVGSPPTTQVPGRTGAVAEQSPAAPLPRPPPSLAPSATPPGPRARTHVPSVMTATGSRTPATRPLQQPLCKRRRRAPRQTRPTRWADARAANQSAFRRSPGRAPLPHWWSARRSTRRDADQGRSRKQARTC